MNDTKPSRYATFYSWREAMVEADHLARTRITLYTERVHFHDFCNDLLEEGNE